MRINRIVSMIVISMLILMMPFGVSFRSTDIVEATTGQSLVLTSSPSVLTAGVVSELVDPSMPLTVYITDQNGSPVDLTTSSNGEHIEEDIVWNMLFNDPHPDNIDYYGHSASLPQYYWTRTDLHNDDNSSVCNEQLFGKRMIEIDFSMANDGIYIFKGFVANDVGNFYIRVHTPDRKRAGSVKIPVRSPEVSYEIINIEDPDMVVFDSPGDPDFVMTALDNRIYNINVSCRDAMGNIIRGISEGVSLCTGISRTARFTPFTTRPENYEWTEDPEEVVDINFYSSGTAYFLSNLGDRYDLHLGLDLNNNGKLEWTNKELHAFGAQKVRNTNSNSWTNYNTYYNTTNYMYSSGEFSEHPFFDLPPAIHGGWGLGCIYNSSKFGGMVFSDHNDDKKIDYRDSLNLDQAGQTSFYLFAEDACSVGGLVGDSYWGDYDVAGRPPYDETSPKYTTSRYRGDGVYYLDFDAVADNTAQIEPPRFNLLWAETRDEINKQLLDPDLYDLIYAVPNHVVALVSPADYRDLPVKTLGQVGLVGNQSEHAIFGKIEDRPEYGTREATMYYTPTGIGREIIELRYQTSNKWYNAGLTGSPRNYYMDEVMWIDSVMGLKLEFIWTELPRVGNESTIEILCQETGSDKPVPDVLITLQGAGINQSSITNQSGIARFKCTFEEMGTVTVKASKTGFIDGDNIFSVGKDDIPPELIVEPIPSITNKDSVQVNGSIGEQYDVSVSANGRPISIGLDGNFSTLIKLEPGENTIIMVAKDEAGNITTKQLSITFDNEPPPIILYELDKQIDVDEVEISGRVEIGSDVRVNSKNALVVADLFRVSVPVVIGLNQISVSAMDNAGNITVIELDVIVWHKTSIQMQIGNSIIIVEGKATPPLEAPPYIKNDRTMVPIRAISQGFGADVEWIPEDRSVAVTLDDGQGKTSILMKIGSTTALVNGEIVILDAEPEIVEGRTFVPLRFVAENLGCEVEYESLNKTITMERLSF